MTFTEKTISLKDGRTALLRNAREEDAAGMLDYITAACGETDFLASVPEEWGHDEAAVENEKKWILNSVRSENTLMLCCELEGRIVGNCEIRFFTGVKTRHRAAVAIAVLKEAWSLGIGSAMFEEMLAEARKRGTQIVELDFIEGNDRARHLYEKFGFRVVGMKPDIFRLRDGTYANEYYMQKRM